MRLFDADVQVRTQDQKYLIRVEATPRMAALLFALGVEFRCVSPAEDSGRSWYQFEYSERFDTALKDLLDTIGDLIYRQPAFGQMVLFEDAPNG